MGSERARDIHYAVQDFLAEHGFEDDGFEGLDSLSKLHLLHDVEDSLNVSIDITVLEGVTDLGKLVDNIVGYIGGEL